MNTSEYKDLVDTPLFASLSEKEFNKIIDCCAMPKIHSFKKREIIVCEGELFANIGLILSGWVSICKEDLSGNSILINEIMPGDILGLIPLLSGASRWHFSAHANKDCTIAFIEPFFKMRKCEKQCEGHQIIIDNFLKIMSQKSLYLFQRMQFLNMKNIRQKVSSYLIDQQRLQGSIMINLLRNRQELADYLNVQRSSLSRELCLLRDMKLIDFNKSTIKILNPEILESYALYDHWNNR